ncbi:MAG: hypothetical protein ACT4NV_08590 [Rhodoferax sp.]
MTAGNPPSASLFRSLGADDSYFDAKARAASKEAEQRWPLFKAVAPARAEETPVLSAQDKEASWNTPPAGADAPPRARLSRPGLGQKLATGLRELGHKTRQESMPSVAASARTPPLPAAALPESPSAKAPNPPPPVPRPVAASVAPPARVAAPPQAPARTPLMAGARAPAAVPLPPLAGALGRPQAPAQAAQEPATPAAAPARKKGLFAPAPQAPAAALAKPAHSGAPADPSLSGLFARLSGQTPPPAAAAPKRGLLFGRSGR